MATAYPYVPYLKTICLIHQLLKTEGKKLIRIKKKRKKMGVKMCIIIVLYFFISITLKKCTLLFVAKKIILILLHFLKENVEVDEKCQIVYRVMNLVYLCYGSSENYAHV